MLPALLDTDVLSEFFRGNPKVIAKVDAYLKEHKVISVSVITYYEVLNGLLYKDARNLLDRLTVFAIENQVLPLTKRMAEEAAGIQAALRRRGQVISHTDTLIAGTAIVGGFELVSNNTGHFNRIKGLALANWTK